MFQNTVEKCTIVSRQFAEITHVSLPSTYKRFLETVGTVNFDLGWVLSAACVTTGIDFYDKLL